MTKVEHQFHFTKSPRKRAFFCAIALVSMHAATVAASNDCVKNGIVLQWQPQKAHKQVVLPTNDRRENECTTSTAKPR